MLSYTIGEKRFKLDNSVRVDERRSTPKNAAVGCAAKVDSEYTTTAQPKSPK